MSNIRRPKSEAAMNAARSALGPCHPNTAALLLFLASVDDLAAAVGRRKASELVYAAADDLATGDRP